MDTRMEQVLKLAGEITQLRDQLRRKEEDLQELMALRAGGQITLGPFVEADNAADSLPQRIRRVMKSEPGRKFSAGEIADRLPGASIKLIRSSLFRIAKESGFKKARRGLYVYRDVVLQSPFSDGEGNKL